MRLTSFCKWVPAGQRRSCSCTDVLKAVVSSILMATVSLGSMVFASSGGRGSARAARRKTRSHPSGADGAFPSRAVRRKMLNHRLGADGAFPSRASVSRGKSVTGHLGHFLFVMPALAGMFVLPCASQAQAIELTANATRPEVQIADPFEFVITVTGPSDTKVNFQKIDDKLGSFDVLEIKDRVGQAIVGDSSGSVWTRTLLLETIETGDQRVPEIEISVKEKSGSAKLLWTNPVEIAVVSVVESSADLTRFADIADLVDVDQSDSPSTSAVWVSLAAGFVLALLAGGFLIAKRQKTAGSARDWALAQFSDPETDFVRVETVVRRFLEERFAFPATSLSSTAIIDQLLQVGVSLSLVSGVEQAFAMSERVKFGGFSISQGEEAKLLDNARSLISELDDLTLNKQDLDPHATQKGAA